MSSDLLLQQFEAFLVAKGLSDSNREKCARVVKKLVNGNGIKHKNRPGSKFCEGRRVTLDDDLEKLRLEAKRWLPYQKNQPNCLDGGHGWALNHPLARLRDFQRSRATASVATAATTTTTSATAVHDLSSDDDDDDDEEEEEEEEPERKSAATAATTTAMVMRADEATKAVASMELVEDDGGDGGDGGDDITMSEMGGMMVMHATTNYKYVWPKAHEQFARTCHMNRKLCAHLKKKGVLHKAHPQMKAFIGRFFNENPDQLDGTGLTLGGFAVDHVVAKNGEGIDHVVNFHLMPSGVNSHFGDNWNSEKRRYVGDLAAKPALGLHAYFKRGQYEFDFSSFKPMHYM